MSATLETIIQHIESHTGKKARKSPGGYRTVCPGHGGNGHNLSLADGDTRVKMHCHSHGCDPRVILEAVGLSIKDVFYENLDPVQKKAISEKSILKEFLFEQAILSLWANDKINGKYPRKDCDRFRIKKAMNRSLKAIKYLEGTI